MRLQGFCTECRQIRWIRVNWGRPRYGNLPTGICVRCEDAKNDRKKGKV